jgi:hypothetical protein
VVPVGVVPWHIQVIYGDRRRFLAAPTIDEQVVEDTFQPGFHAPIRRGRSNRAHHRLAPKILRGLQADAASEPARK